MPNKYYLREDRKAVKPEAPEPTPFHSIAHAIWDDDLESLPALDVDPDYLKTLSPGWFEGEERYEFLSIPDAEQSWLECTKEQFDLTNHKYRRLTIVAPQEAEKGQEDASPFVDKKCIHCGKEFQGLPDGSYCSITCWDAHCLHGVPNIEQPATTKEQQEKGQEGKMNYYTESDVRNAYSEGWEQRKNHFDSQGKIIKDYIDCENDYIKSITSATPQPVTGEEVELAKEYADKVMPFVWPKNKRGEDIQMLVGQKNPPFSAKHRREQQKIIDAYLAGYQAASRPSDAVEKDEQYGTSFEADFENNTWTFLMDQPFHVMAGRFKIIPLPLPTPPTK